MNLLLDTNVIIDFLGRKPPFFADAAEIIAAGYFGDVTLWAPAQSFKDAFYVLENFVDSERVQDAMLSLAQVVNLSTSRSSVGKVGVTAFSKATANA